MKGLPLASFVLVLTASYACADPYWITYTGDAFPETEGWTRYSSDPPAERWLEDGKLFIDSLAEFFMQDIYHMSFDGTLNPDPGELFVARWRLKVHEIIGVGDPGVVILSDDEYGLSVLLGYDKLWTNPFTEFVPFEPELFHVYELRSWDMREYEFFVDGVSVLHGSFATSLVSGRVDWGDIASHSSLAEWDYFSFGVVPEPGTCLACTMLAVIFFAHRRRERASVCSRQVTGDQS